MNFACSSFQWITYIAKETGFILKKLTVHYLHVATNLYFFHIIGRWSWSFKSFRYYMYISWCFQRISQIQALVFFKMLVIPQFYPVFLHSIPFGTGALISTGGNGFALVWTNSNADYFGLIVLQNHKKMFTIRTPPPSRKKNPWYSSKGFIIVGGHGVINL